MATSGDLNFLGEVVSAVATMAVFIGTHLLTWWRGIRRLEKRVTLAESSQQSYAEKTEIWQNNLLATLKERQDNVQRWQEEHKREADSRDKVMVGLEVLCKSIDTTVQLTTKRMDAFEDWCRNHDQWAAGKVEQIGKISELANTQAKLLEVTERRLQLLEQDVRDRRQHSR